MEITSNNPNQGDAKEEIEVEYKGKDLRIGFNAALFSRCADKHA